jgi:hypothetical protein
LTSINLHKGLTFTVFLRIISSYSLNLTRVAVLHVYRFCQSHAMESKWIDILLVSQYCFKYLERFAVVLVILPMPSLTLSPAVVNLPAISASLGSLLLAHGARPFRVIRWPSVCCCVEHSAQRSKSELFCAILLGKSSKIVPVYRRSRFHQWYLILMVHC